MKEFKKSKFFIVFVIIMAVIYLYDGDLYNELKTTINSDKDEVVESQSVSLTDSDELLSPLKVYFLDVGQADSILIECNDEYMLIDAGNNEDGDKLVKYFESLDIEKFKYLIGTHAHEDHIGGMDDIINNFDADMFYMPDVVTTTKTFEDVIDALADKNMYFDTPSVGDKLSLGGAILEVVYIGDDSSDINNTSIVLRLVYENVSFLFTADAESSAEKIILNNNIDISSTVLKVGHHGSSTSTTTAFLKRVSPSYAVISSGEGNSYGHPHDEIVEKFYKNNVKIYRTDELGTIVASSNGKEINFSSVDTDTDGN